VESFPLEKKRAVTRADIVDAIYEYSGYDKQTVHSIVGLFCEAVKNALIQGYPVELRGFGTFELRLRKGRSKAHNPKTGVPVTVKSHGVAAFRAGRELKKAVWNTPILANNERKTEL
jgi:integration host factor subunit beta